MRKHRKDEFRVDMHDGLVIERLPIGLANDHWYVAFVLSGVDSLTSPSPDFLIEFRKMVVISDAERPDWVFESEGGGSSGGGDEQFVWWLYSRQAQGGPEWPPGPLTTLEINYLQNGTTLAGEIIDLA